MRRRLCLCLAVCAVLGLGAFACSGGSNPEEYEGDAPGECSDGADNDRDGLFDCDDPGCANSPDCGCDDKCSPAGSTECDGTVLKTCVADDDGCLDFSEQDCADSGMLCSPSGCFVEAGYCHTTGEPCGGDENCPTVEIQGFCIVDDGGAGSWACGFDTRFETGSTVECEGQTVRRCNSVADCPDHPDMRCEPFGSAWCGADVPGICVFSDGAAPPCEDDAECTFTASNACVLCGDGERQGQGEECDDGNTTDGDGCSSLCQFERHCFKMAITNTGCECRTDSNCLFYCHDCMGGDCTCLGM